MKFIIIFRGFLFVILSFSSVFAQDEGIQFHRQKLNELIQQRHDRFKEYTVSVERKTGIFGLQSKRDLKRTTEVLSEIVILDNEIMRHLEKIGEEQTYKKTIAQIDTRDFEKRIHADSLRINRLTQEKQKYFSLAESHRQDLSRYKIYMGLMIMGLAVMVIYMVSSRRRSKS